jgi:ComF family protein
MPISNLAKHFLNLIYPIHCASCEKPLGALDETRVCPDCLARIRPNPMPRCRKCGRAADSTRICRECRTTKLHFDRAHSACLYEGPLKEIIHRFKYNGSLVLAGPLSRFMVDFVNNNPSVLEKIDMITYVPLGAGRLRKRTFNQSQALAAGLAEEFGIGLCHALSKTRSTKAQNELSRDRRITNLNGAFRVRRGADVKDSRILLVDDVMTTGATLSECAKVLKGSGAKEVRCLTLARGL